MIPWTGPKDPWMHGWGDCCDMADGERHEWGRPPPAEPEINKQQALAKTQEILTSMGWKPGQFFPCACKLCFGSEKPPHHTTGCPCQVCSGVLHAPLPEPIDRPWCHCRECREARALKRGAA